MSESWGAAAEWILQAEGGYSQDPSDRGGETHYGVTWPTLRRAQNLRLVPYSTTIRELTRTEALVIYKALYWDLSHCEDMPPALGLAVFDAAVHSGPMTAAKWLQHALSVAQGATFPEDGIVGQMTVALTQSLPVGPVLHEFLGARREFLHRIAERDPRQHRFERGWENRLQALEERCRQLLEQAA